MEQWVVTAKYVNWRDYNVRFIENDGYVFRYGYGISDTAVGSGKINKCHESEKMTRRSLSGRHLCGRI